jgi:hypothetical protein
MLQAHGPASKSRNVEAPTSATWAANEPSVQVPRHSTVTWTFGQNKNLHIHNSTCGNPRSYDVDLPWRHLLQTPVHRRSTSSSNPPLLVTNRSQCSIDEAHPILRHLQPLRKPHPMYWMRHPLRLLLTLLHQKQGHLGTRIARGKTPASHYTL